MSMYGAYPKVKNSKGIWVEQNGLEGAPKAWPVTDCSKDKRLTVQAPKDETDINKIIKRIEKGQMIRGVADQGRFEDVSEYDGLSDAFIKTQRAQEAFMTLSAEIRARFENDPVQLIEFLQDGNNRKEAEELGLIAPPEPAPIPPVSDNAPPEMKA